MSTSFSDLPPRAPACGTSTGDVAAWAGREGLALTLREGNVEEMPFDDGSFGGPLNFFRRTKP